MTEPLFEARSVHKRFGRNRVLQGVDLKLTPGAVTVLLGRNGTGKSTLLRLAIGALKANQGQVRVFGMEPHRRPTAVGRRIGYVPDSPDAPAWMTLAELLRFTSVHYPTWNHSLAAELLERFELDAKQRVKELSRGQGMKAMLLLALAHEPELLLLDEPFAGLDPVVREEVLRAVLGALGQGQRTVLLSTHELDVAARIADEIAVLKDGRIVEHGTLQHVLGEPEPAQLPERLLRILESPEQERAAC